MALGVLPYRVYVVHTGSMSPTIPVDSAVIVHQGVYRVGQVITFNTVNGVVTHRLVARRSDGTLVTQGDANKTPDPGQIPPSAVIGGVVAAPPLLGYLLTYMRNPLGLASAVAFLIVLWLVFSLAGTGLRKRQAINA
jgi:signal peptidase